MKRSICLSLLMLLTLTGCAVWQGSPAPVASAPPPSDLTLEEWAARYPEEYADWQGSVHGEAYLAGNEDAPSCTDCHSDPETGEVETAAFRLEIPARCARCHDDGALMAEYGIAGDTYQSYQADYHGTTIEYYRAHDPSAWRYEAVCSDCHGSHAIYPPEDPRSSVAEANMLTTCQKCHLGAEAQFAQAPFGHFRLSRAANVVVYGVGLAYRILIPAVIGLMLAYIALDIVHRLRTRSKGAEK